MALMKANKSNTKLFLCWLRGIKVQQLISQGNKSDLWPLMKSLEISVSNQVELVRGEW